MTSDIKFKGEDLEIIGRNIDVHGETDTPTQTFTLSASYSYLYGSKTQIASDVMFVEGETNFSERTHFGNYVQFGYKPTDSWPGLGNFGNAQEEELNAIDQNRIDIPDPCDLGPLVMDGIEVESNPGLGSTTMSIGDSSNIVQDFVMLVSEANSANELAEGLVDLSKRTVRPTPTIPPLAADDASALDDGMAADMAACLLSALENFDGEQLDLMKALLLKALSDNVQLASSGYPATSVNTDLVVHGNVYVLGKIVHEGDENWPHTKLLSVVARILGVARKNGNDALFNLHVQLAALKDELEIIASRLRDRLPGGDPLGPENPLGRIISEVRRGKWLSSFGHKVEFRSRRGD